MTCKFISKNRIALLKALPPVIWKIGFLKTGSFEGENTVPRRS